MLNNIKQFLKCFKLKKHMKNIQQYTRLNPNTKYGNTFRCELREPQNGKVYLEIGEHCIIDGQFIFESENGHVSVGDRSFVNGTIISINNVEIGDDVIVAWDTLIYDHNSHSLNWEERKHDHEEEYNNYIMYGNPCANKDWSVVKSKPIKICDKAWVGTGCKILKGVTIGEGAVVQAGAVVVRDVEAWTVVGGNPAQVIKRLK